MSIINKSIGISLLVIALSACGKPHVEIPFPKRPEIKTVKVRNNSIVGESLSNVIENHINAWKYITELEALYGKRVK